MALWTKAMFCNEAIVFYPIEEMLWLFEMRNLFPREMLSEYAFAVAAFPGD